MYGTTTASGSRASTWRLMMSNTGDATGSVTIGGADLMISSSTSSPSTARSSRSRSSSVWPGSVRPSISNSATPGITFVFAPARTTVAEAVLLSSAEKLRAIDAPGTSRATRASSCGRASSLTSGWISAGCRARKRVEEVGDVRRRVNRQLRAGRAAASASPSLRDDAVVPRHRAVAGLAGDPRAHPAEALLGDLDRIERRVAEVEREPADLADRVLGLDLRAVLLDEEPRAEIAAGLLVGDRREDHVAIEPRAASPRAAA